MSGKDSPNLSKKTWARSMEPVSKIGYMDGASEGQASVYQQSFDVGYEQGFYFGFTLGLREAALNNNQTRTPLTKSLLDPRKINCQICLSEVKLQENITNLYNTQKEKNFEVLKVN